jgi:hypothetical protein
MADLAGAGFLIRPALIINEVDLYVSELGRTGPRWEEAFAEKSDRKS